MSKTTAQLYREYLAATAAVKRLDSLGLQVERAVTGSSTSSDFWRNRLEKELEDGEVPNLYQFGEVQVYPEYGFPPDIYLLSTEERERAQQEIREDFVRRFVARYPDVVVARHGGSTSIYWEPLDGIGVTVNVGQALCERVIVGEVVEEIPDPELVAELPKVKKVTPKYEWRCNDAELR